MSTTSLARLAAAPRSGRSRALLIDHDDYTNAVIRQNAKVPWNDVTALTNHFGQVIGLLQPDAVWVDIGELYRAYVEAHPGLREAMGARQRAGTALRVMLGDEEAVAHTATALRTIAQSGRRSLVLALPSPARWVDEAHRIAGTPLDEVDEDRADSASMYVAEWLGHFGEIPVALVVLDARLGAEQEQVVVERLDQVDAVSNVAGHFEWTVAVRDAEGFHVSPENPALIELDAQTWLGDGPAPAAGEAGSEVLVTQIPAEAVPEQVLSRLAALA